VLHITQDFDECFTADSFVKATNRSAYNKLIVLPRHNVGFEKHTTSLRILQVKINFVNEISCVSRHIRYKNCFHLLPEIMEMFPQFTTHLQNVNLLNVKIMKSYFSHVK
jgi:hypothetical protein